MYSLSGNPFYILYASLSDVDSGQMTVFKIDYEQRDSNRNATFLNDKEFCITQCIHFFLTSDAYSLDGKQLLMFTATYRF